MLINDFMTKEIPVLKKGDTVSYVLQLMDEFKVRHLPMVDNGMFECLIDEKSLLSRTNVNEVIGSTVISSPSVDPVTHILDALSYFTRFKVTVLPVVSKDKSYLGSITRNSLVDALSETLGSEQPGSIIVLEIRPTDYSLTDIARIVEGNNAHVLTLISTIAPDTGLIHVSLKIDLEDASPVIRSFERFNYTILFHFMNHSVVFDILQQRVDELIHYINM